MGRFENSVNKGVLLLSGAAAAAVFMHFFQTPDEQQIVLINSTPSTSITTTISDAAKEADSPYIVIETDPSTNNSSNSFINIKSPSTTTISSISISEAVAVPIETITENSSLININSATASQLTSLPGIGEVKANAIIEYRNINGVFRAADDLLNVSGIGQKTLEKIRGLITV